MRRLFLLLACLSIPAAIAQDLRQPITAMLYWEMPLSAVRKSESANAFGFRLDRAPVTGSVVLKQPIVDVRFNPQGFHSLAFRGSVLHQNQPASGVPAPELNWWIVGGIAAGAVIAIHNDNKNKNDATAKKGGGTI